MKFEDLRKIYDEKRKPYGAKAYLYVSEIFDELRELYKQEYLKSEKAEILLAKDKVPDAEQSWKSWKGHNFEKLIIHIVKSEVESLGLSCVRGDELSRKKLSMEFSKVHRNLLIRYGKYSLLPDADLVIYKPITFEIIGILSCKITLRERVAQTAYWKLKLANDPVTMKIKGYFVTTDEDGNLIKGVDNPHRNRIIVEHELDGTYVLRNVQESDKVKAFPKLIDDLRRLANGSN